MSEPDESPIGYYGNSFMVCRLCGHEFRTVHPLPIKMPCECPNCGNMTAYFFEEETERDER